MANAYFDLRLTPNRSFDRAHIWRVVGGVAVIFAVMGARLWVLGAWPVVPFMIIDVALLWGTHTATSAEIHTYDEMVESARAYALSNNIAKQGERIVIVAGIPFATIGTTNNIRVVRI